VKLMVDPTFETLFENIDDDDDDDDEEEEDD
jgi:hypothetical protein